MLRSMESNRSIDRRLALVLDGRERFVSEKEVLQLELLPNSGQVWVSSY